MQDFLEKTMEQLEDMQISFDEIDREGTLDADVTPIRELIESLMEEVSALSTEEE